MREMMDGKCLVIRVSNDMHTMLNRIFKIAKQKIIGYRHCEFIPNSHFLSP